MNGSSHRPWPLPSERPVMDMTWHDLLFMHYPVPVDQIRNLVPHSLEIDTFGGTAWIGIIPFRMSKVKPYGFPSVPWVSAFPEINVRTYVTDGKKSGVWFFSLDAANPLAVAAARQFFHLPYFNAKMSVNRGGSEIVYRSLRKHRGAPDAEFCARYFPTGSVFYSKKESIEHWLTERYCLYSVDRIGRARRVDIHHAPWPLQPAEANVSKNTMSDWLGLNLPETPLLHFALRLEVVAWRANAVGTD